LFFILDKNANQILKLCLTCGSLNFCKIFFIFLAFFSQNLVSTSAFEEFLLLFSLKFFFLVNHIFVVLFSFVKLHIIKSFFVFFHQMRELSEVFFEIGRFSLCLLFKVLDLIIRLVSFLICRIGKFNNIGHFFPFFMQFVFKFLVQIVKNNSFPSKTIDLLSQLLVYSDCFIEFLIGFIQSIFQDFYLFN